MRRIKLSTLFAAAVLWLCGQSVNAVTLQVVDGTNGGSIARLVDGDNGSKWEGGFGNGQYVIVKNTANLPITPANYTIVTGNDNASWNGRGWKAWKIYGANFAFDAAASRDAAEWVLLDEKSNITQDIVPDVNSTPFDFNFSEAITAGYVYFKIEITELQGAGYMQMCEFILNDCTVDASVANELTNYDTTGADADLVAAYSAGVSAFSAAETQEDKEAALATLASLRQKIETIKSGRFISLAWSDCWGDGPGSNLVDKKEGTKWGGNFPDEGEHVQYVVFRGQSMQPFFYKLVTGNDTASNTGRNWKTWKVFGGNFATEAEATKDAEGWVVLDEREDISEEYLPMKNFYPATFDFNKGVSEAYSFYKIEVYASGGSQQQMSEMYLCTEEEFEEIRKPLVEEFADFDVENLVVPAENAQDKENFVTLYEELKTTSDAVRLTKVYNELVALRESLEDAAEFLAGGYRALAGNTAWGDGENWTKLVDGDIQTKWGGGMPEEGSFVIFKAYEAKKYVAYELVTGNDTQNSPDRNWKNWKIYGVAGKVTDENINRDLSWTLLDSKEDIGQDQLPGANFAPAFFGFSEEWAKAYKYFKIEVEAAYNNGGSIQMSEFKMFTEEDWKAVCQEYADSLVRLEAEVTGGLTLTETVAKEVAAAVAAVADAQPTDLLQLFAEARELILGAVKRSYAEAAQGAAECILPSMKWGGDYKAFTYVAQGDFEYGDWNESNPNYNKIIGVPEAQNGKAWYTPDYNVAAWNYGKDLPNFGDGRPADVYAVRYFTVEGEIPSTVYMPAAHDDAPCEYYINGELIWAETDGWNEYEVVRLTDSQKALIKTDGTVNVFAFHVHQNWGGRYADGGLYTAGDMVNDFNNDVRALDATIALAEAEGIDAALIDFAKAKSAYRGGIGAGLAKLRQARRFAADSRTENFKGTAPADGLTAYILNVGAKMFLAGGNDWGTHASLNHMGAKCVLHANSSGENRYAIQTNLPNGRRGANDGLGHNGYVDCGYGDDFTTAEGWAWTFEALEDGTYHIINAQNSGTNIYLGMTDDDRLQVDTDKSGADNPFNKWILVTPEEFMALAEEATVENPVDLGHLIHQATFSANDFDGDDKGAANADLNDSKWERNAGSIWEWKSGNSGNCSDHMFEMWNTADAGKVYLKQVVEGLPAGKYTVSMSGYYRDGNYDDAIAGNVRQLAYLYAGSEENCVPLAGIMEGEGNVPGYGRDGRIPDGCYDAAKFFQVGTYTNTIDAVVGADGKLEIGVFRDAQDVKGGDWITTDNWRLFYMGNVVDVAIPEAGYATFVAPGYIDAVPEGVEAYAAQVKEGYVHLEPTRAIPAGEAVVLKGAEGSYSMNISEKEANLALVNDLKAATEEVTADGSQYILAELEDKVGFAKATPETKIAAGKGYLVISAAVKAFYPFDEDATAIENATVNVNEGAIYNISGQRVNKAQKGIYIINGKKVLR